MNEKAKLFMNGNSLEDKNRIFNYYMFRECKEPILINISGKSKISTRPNKPNDIWMCSSDMSKKFFNWFKKQKFNLVLDIGANIGRYSLIFSETAEKVVAFEPCKENFKALQDNIRYNKRKNIICFNFGVYDETKRIKINLGENNEGSSSIFFDRKYKKEIIDVIKLDDFIIGKVDFIKIDVEGVELNVLRGAENLLKKCRPIVYLEITRQKKEILYFMKSLGYKATKLDGDYLFK